MKTMKYAVRFLMRSRSYTLINLLGLAFSLACSIILIRYIHRELTVDTHCADREQVYAVKVSVEGSEFISSISEYEYDKVEIDKSLIDVATSITPLDEDFLTVNGQRFPSRTIVTDSAFFKLFSYPLLQGSLALDKPTSVLLKKDFALKLFGKENPIGQTIRHSNGKDLTVEGIIDEPDCKSSIGFDMVLSYHLSNAWERMPKDLYRFLPGTDMEAIRQIGNTPRYMNNPQWDSRQYTFSFIPIKETYWHGELQDQKTMFRSGQESHLYILSGVCLLVFLTGLLNFVNLYLVAMLRRGKEYGLKKVYGASGRNLFTQIWLENVVLTGVALCVAWFFIEVTQIPINRLLDATFTYTPFDGWLSLGILTLLPLAASVYPFLKYQYGSPIRTIQSIGWSNRSVRSRMVFLGIQYVLTFLLTVCALYFNKQLDLMLHTEPGFRTKNIICAKLLYSSQDFSVYDKELWEKDRARTRTITERVKACPFIEYTQGCSNKLSSPGYETFYLTPDGNKVLLAVRYVSPDYFKMFGIELEEGTISDKEEQYVVNRAAMKALQFSGLEGASVVEENKYRRNNNVAFKPIVGIAKDCYHGHLTTGAQPTIYSITKFTTENEYIAYPEGKLQDLLQYLQGIMEEMYGVSTVEYTLLEDEMKALYDEDRKIAGIYNIFALIAIIISCLGLFGISLFDIRQRYREIAIRKVNGAGLKDLYKLLFRKYMVVLGASFVVAVPIAYFLIHRYTADFAIKAPTGIGIFALALLVVAAISMGTLWWQIRKAANIDPASVMKAE